MVCFSDGYRWRVSASVPGSVQSEWQGVLHFAENLSYSVESSFEYSNKHR